jgi:hypothetical protein
MSYESSVARNAFLATERTTPDVAMNILSTKEHT